jgi:hypothetical protein
VQPGLAGPKVYKNYSSQILIKLWGDEAWGFVTITFCLRTPLPAVYRHSSIVYRPSSIHPKNKGWCLRCSTIIIFLSLACSPPTKTLNN